MQFQVDAQNSGARLDVFLTTETKLSRSAVQKLIDAGKVKVNGITAHKTGFTLAENDQIHTPLPSPRITHLKPADIPLDILYEDEDMLVINKPAGIVVHPDSTGHHENTIVNALLHHLNQSSDGNLRPGVVHRLDKDTSGVLLLAKNDASLQRLSKLFHDRKVHKTYLALVKGTPKTEEGRIDAPIRRDTQKRQQMAISKHGKRAVTTFKIIQTWGWASLLEVNIETGRTHQIRLHLASIGHPVLGDPVYGDADANERAEKELGLTRQFLHAEKLELEGRTWSATLPKDLTLPT